LPFAFVAVFSKNRLRDIVVAGGAVVTVTAGCNEGVNFCCNANPDPCCGPRYCGTPMTDACRCQMAGGAWDYSAADGGSCGPGIGDGGSSDADAHD
jgi:hypothetical protein